MSSWITPPGSAATGVGALPHTDPRQACDDVLAIFPEFPYVPTLPNHGILESIVFCDSGKLPGGVVRDGRLGIDETRDIPGEMEQIYLDFIDQNTAPYALTPEYASGFAEMSGRNFLASRVLKCQVTGPVSFGMQIVDASRRPIYYDDQYADLLAKMIALRARWCEEAMTRFSGVKQTLVVLNEPYFASLGSTVVPVQQETVTAGWHDIAGMVEGGLGIHCCSNTDWAYVTSLDPAFLSFDAYSGAREFLLFMEDIVAFMERGGVIAWGLVPAQVQDFKTVTQEELYRRFQEIQNQVTEFCPSELFFQQSVITPTCGIQAGDPAASVEIMRSAAALSSRIREERSA
ncbi:MAG: hypothetical protein LUQ37_09015 [Methanoregulaceae archaeon]|jgi:hypothetical protein|nr:hypothetical protein [Methanoregulaceae archaeon]